MADVAIVSVDYDDDRPETLRGFTVTLNGVESRFDTLDEAYGYAFGVALNVANSSSVDQYKADIKKRGSIH